MIELNTKRLLLKTPDVGDENLFASFELKNEAHFSRFTPNLDRMLFSNRYWTQKINAFIQEFAHGSSVRFMLFDKMALTASLIGVCNFTQIFRGAFHACYLGYKLDGEYEGRGLMYEALERACSYMFEEQNLHRIMANYIPANLRSEKLLVRLGFQKEGYAPQYLLINDKWEDHVLTSLTNRNWKKKSLPESV